MAKNPVKGRAGSPLPAAAPPAQDGAHGVTRPIHNVISVLPICATHIFSSRYAQNQFKILFHFCIQYGYVVIRLKVHIKKMAPRAFVSWLLF